MTTSMIVKVTIDEFATPGLFRAVSAVPNPRQRASQLKRLAEDALRNSVPTSQIVPAATTVTAGNSVISRAVRSGAAPTSYSTPGGLFWRLAFSTRIRASLDINAQPTTRRLQASRKRVSPSQSPDLIS